jgi:S23 ribosomal protein.
MGPIKSYRDLVVWQKSMDLVDACYAVTSRFPATERFGITSQIRRSAVSIAANIAEGLETGRGNSLTTSRSPGAHFESWKRCSS